MKLTLLRVSAVKSKPVLASRIGTACTEAKMAVATKIVVDDGMVG